LGKLRAVLIGIAVSVPITLISAFAGFPIAFYLLGITTTYFGFFGPILAFMTVPVLANIFVWRAYMVRRSRAAQYSLLVTGIMLSVILAFVFFAGLILSLLAEA
jgi:hypothetical protein